ncbi:membrane-associated protein [Abditibacterium utsteinense]|uniref:Membrane-associated protein n=1 Tax=Abditibacterium utsteinense TaxID=1960156 RepID=A0A2S8SS65_9BACT|nr:VTT domain-containing protein [Abditibacterium utsteinense]PQV63618.1 membrane-associated protein [Abditibacterium utsteinense]
MDFFRQLFDVKHGGMEALIQNFGYALLFAIIFAETGLLIGFLLPGDSLIFIAGLMAFKGHLNIALLIVLLSLAAIAGDSVGYFIGKKIGKPLFERGDSKFFKRKHLESARVFYEKHGPKTIVLARFVPIVRTFVPTVAGAAGMNYLQFLTYNIGGGLLWIITMSLLGYFFGQVIPAQHLDKAVLGIIIVSVVPMIFHAIKEKRAAKNAPPQSGHN